MCGDTRLTQPAQRLLWSDVLRLYMYTYICQYSDSDSDSAPQHAQPATQPEKRDEKSRTRNRVRIGEDGKSPQQLRHGRPTAPMQSKHTRTCVPPLRAVRRAGAAMRLLSTPQRQNCCIGEVEALRSATVGPRGITGWSIPAEHGWLCDARPGPRNWGCGLGMFVWQCIVDERLPYITTLVCVTYVCACGWSAPTLTAQTGEWLYEPTDRKNAIAWMDGWPQASVSSCATSIASWFSFSFCAPASISPVSTTVSIAS